MTKRTALAALFLLSGAAAQAADVQMGGVTLKLIPPAGYCELDVGQPSDKRMIDFLNTALGKGTNELLGVSADCKELRDWRTGSRKLLEHFSQYQVEKVRRASSYTIDEAKASCAAMRAEGQKLSDDGTKNVKDDIHAANKKIDFQGQTFLGVLAEDANGCYVGLFQKYKAETGQQIRQLNVFYAGSLKDRQVFLYVWAPYVNDASIEGMLAGIKSQVATLKGANGL
ncbi:MAG: hypothetical protein QOG38_1295 [Hyphomicrobiales bacterium]|jgi:hypothetical protein|nr:hypothetical protein [Hyphomicrobiales bacterium]